MATVLKRFSGRMQKRNTSLVYTTKISTHPRANKHTCLFITSVRLLLFLCPPHAKHQMGQACRLQQVRLPPSRQPKHLTSVVLTPSQGITPHRRTTLHTTHPTVAHNLFTVANSYRTSKLGPEPNCINLCRYKGAHQPDRIGHNFVSYI